MSIFKRKRKKKKNSDTDSTNLSYDSVSASPGSRRGSISESIVSFGSSGSPPGSIVKAHWKLLVGAQESTWRSRASLLIGNDLLLLGAHEASVENTDPPMQLYFCDTTRKVWSTSVLKGKGPGYSIFYAALAFPFSTERLFVFWPCPQRGRVARMMQSFEAKKTGELTVEEGKLFVVLDESDPIWVGGMTTDGGMGVVPRSCLSFDNVPVQQTTRLELSVLNCADDMQWSTMICDGELPKCRRYFSYNAIGDNKIFLFGGLTDFNEPTNAVYALDTDKYHWKRCTSRVAIPPKARYGHSSTVVMDGHSLLIFGGTDGDQYFNDMYLFNTESFTWQLIKPKGRAPESRAFHSMTRLDDTPWVVLFGGRNASTTLADVHLFNYETQTWHRALLLGDIPTPRFEHFAGCSDDNIIFFGGRDGMKNFFDIYSLQVEGIPKTTVPQMLLEADQSVTAVTDSSPRPMTNELQGLTSGTESVATLRVDPSPQLVSEVVHSAKQGSNISAEPAMPNNIASPEAQGETTREIQSQQIQQNQRGLFATASQNHHSPSAATSTASQQQHQQQQQQQQPVAVPQDAGEHKNEDIEEEVAKLTGARSPSPATTFQTHPHSLAATASTRHSASFRDLIRSVSPTPSMRSSSPLSVMSSRSRSPRRQRPGTPTRSPTPGGHSTFLEDKYAVERTFGDVSNMVDKSAGMRKALYKREAQRPRDSGQNASHVVELAVSFAGHLFETMRQKETNGTQNAGKQKADGQAAAELFDIGKFVASEDKLFDLLFNTAGKANLGSLLRLLRFSKAFDNRLTWFEALSAMSRCLGVEQEKLDDSMALDRSQFRQFMVEIAKVKYPRLARESNFLAFQNFIKTNIEPNFERCNEKDQVLDSIFQADVIRCFSNYSKQIRDLYVMYSALGALSSNVPTWKEVVNKGTTISVAEIMTFTDTFEITPNMVPRHALSQRIVPRACVLSSNGTELELTFTEFLETLGRIAMFIYSSYPYSALINSDFERVEALFDVIGFNDRKKFVMYIRKSGIGAQNKVSGSARRRMFADENGGADEEDPDVARLEYEDLLKDKDRLKDELQRMFMYYCSFGDHLNLDLMSSSKFQKFIRDIKLRPPLKPEEADLIFLRLMKNKGQREGQEDTKLQRMSFPYFIESIKTVAARVYPDIVPTKALVRLLLNNVLPNARRLPEKFTNIDLQNPEVRELLNRHRKLIRSLFYVYSKSDSPDRSSDYMRVEDFVRLMTEFEIIPGIASKKDVYMVFRSTLVDSAYIDITYDQFEECLIKCSAVAYERHPYNVRYYELHLKVNALLEALGIPDWSKIRKKLVKLGHNVPVTPGLLLQKYGGSGSGGFESAKDYNFYEADVLPPEDELDQALRDIFAFYNEYGDKSGRRNLTRQQYIKMVRDCSLVDNHFRDIDADLVYVEATRNNQMPMTFEVFCDSLALLAQRKFPRMQIAEALHDLLLYHVLPFAQRKDSRGRGQDIVIVPEQIQEVLKWEQPLRKIYTSYSKLEAMRPTGATAATAAAAAAAGVNRDQFGETMSLSELLKMCQDFDICPALLSVSDINDIFIAANHGGSADDDDSQLSFEEFVEVVVRMAEKAFSSSHMTTVYKTSTERINALLDRMDLGSAVRLAERLRRLRNFSRQ